MYDIKEKIYHLSPNFIQNILISVFNVIAYKNRYSSKYRLFLKKYLQNNNLKLLELQNIQAEKYKKFILYAKNNSPFYRYVLKKVKNPEDIKNIKNLPIINKEILRQNLSNTYTISKNEGGVSKTGGTTGKSLEVIYTNSDTQERFAILDNFRSKFGYKLGKKTAWFSGKNLLNNKDLKKKRFWKTDYVYNVRYYSTFHMHSNYIEYYLKNLISYSPEFLIGFPSTMYEIAKYGIKNNIEFPQNKIKAIFPTAETITQDIRDVLESFFKTNIYNQYASSEGAPFIMECINKNLHLELQSGVFEVLDENNLDCLKGRLVVTAFNTYGTPLIRYDIGDWVELSNDTCNCGNNNPLVNKILGRVSDYIFSEETGKINLGNISNCLKGVSGIKNFQIIQNEISSLQILVIKDINIFNLKNERIFIKNLRERLGHKIEIVLKYVDKIPVEKSGKFLLIKNNIKDKV